ncbi:hypothetical protein Cch01nite_42170 [Cellulomonas chitinilytica]|uniref:Uncharacterized protein n=1 Tax=Cellulomonas chitinilytica TaxID=398759 RepID=A0A919P5A1_9CELL|nr:hypothetical protein [Cellulomonas chitinilytica]GIG23493.1 hypothetical protein Cch01nite_42170 [Cellulomonas chitinilytica]
MDTSTTTPRATVDTFESANPFLGETETLVVAGRALDGQRVNDIPTQRSRD